MGELDSIRCEILDFLDAYVVTQRLTGADRLKVTEHIGKDLSLIDVISDYDVDWQIRFVFLKTKIIPRLVLSTDRDNKLIGGINSFLKNHTTDIYHNRSNGDGFHNMSFELSANASFDEFFKIFKQNIM